MRRRGRYARRRKAPLPTIIALALITASVVSDSDALLGATVLAVAAYLAHRYLQRPLALALIGAGVMLDKYSRDTFKAIHNTEGN